jgi:hypothetical protein
MVEVRELCNDEEGLYVVLKDNNMFVDELLIKVVIIKCRVDERSFYPICVSNVY